MSRSIRAAPSSMVRACSSSVCPAAVGCTPWRLRTSRGVPTVSSSWASRLLMAEPTMLAFSPARAMLPVSQTLTNRRRVVRSRSRKDDPFQIFRIGMLYLPILQRNFNQEILNSRPWPIGASESASRLPRKVVIREVGLRDGLQSIATVMPTQQKIEWIRAAYDAGQREIEVGSFVPARLLPQLADTAEVLAFARTLPGLHASVLVPNLKGAERAIDGEADLMLVPLSASHAHSLANLRKTPDEVVADIARIRVARDAAGSSHPHRGRPQHRFWLHAAGASRAGRSAAPGQGGAGRRRRPREPGRHGGLRRPGHGARTVRADAAGGGRQAQLRPLP